MLCDGGNVPVSEGEPETIEYRSVPPVAPQRPWYVATLRRLTRPMNSSGWVLLLLLALAVLEVVRIFVVVTYRWLSQP